MNHKLFLIIGVVCSFLGSVGMCDAQTKTPGQPYYGTANVKLDEFDDFRCGFAIVRSGEDFAVMSGNGQLPVPFGKYKFNERGSYKIDKEICGFSNFMCVVRDPISELYGAIDQSAMLVAPCKYEEMTKFGKDGYAWAKRKDDKGQTKCYFIDSRGNEYLSHQQTTSQFGIGQYLYFVNNNSEYTFYRKDGHKVFATKRNVGGIYSDGLIRVDTVYGVAGRKVGFIDTNNQLVIQYKYYDRQVPHKCFHEGLLLLRPSSLDENSYFYIDTKGETRFYVRPDSRFTRTTPMTEIAGIEDGAFFNGMTSYYCNYVDGGAGPVFIDTLGNKYPVVPLALKQLNSKYLDCKFGLNKEDRDNGISFKFTCALDCKIRKSDGTISNPSYFRQCLVTNDGSKVLPPVFTEVGFPDNSGLIRAVYSDGDEERTGYCRVKLKLSDRAF